VPEAARRSPAGFGSFFDKLGRCRRCTRLSGIATGCALAAMLAASWIGVPALEAVTGVLFGGLAALTLGHLIAPYLRPPETTACASCARKRRAWERRHFWRILRYRVRRWRQGSPPLSERAGNCRTCGQKTPLEQMDAQPAAAPGLRHVVERSPQFAQIVPRLAQPEPVDTWEADMLHYFVYELASQADGAAAHALFVARWEDDVPVAASVFTQGTDGPPQVHDLTAALLQH
jgi:hypothetical protein